MFQKIGWIKTGFILIDQNKFHGFGIEDCEFGIGEIVSWTAFSLRFWTFI